MSDITQRDQNVVIWLLICLLTLIFVGTVFGFWLGVAAVSFICILRMWKSQYE